MRFEITWHGDGCGNFAGYKVSIPEFDGGEVVTADEYDRIHAALVEAHRQLSLHDYKGPKQIGRALTTMERALGLPDAAVALGDSREPS